MNLREFLIHKASSMYITRNKEADLNKNKRTKNQLSSFVFEFINTPSNLSLLLPHLNQGTAL